MSGQRLFTVLFYIMMIKRNEWRKWWGGDWRCHAWLRTHCRREISFVQRRRDDRLHFQDKFLWQRTMFDWLLSHRQDPAVSIGRQMLLKENRSAMMKLMKDLEQTATKITDYDQDTNRSWHLTTRVWEREKSYLFEIYSNHRLDEEKAEEVDARAPRFQPSSIWLYFSRPYNSRWQST